MAISDSLFLELARAKAKPSQAFQDTQAGFGAIDQGIEGYLKGQQIADLIQKRKQDRQTLSEVLGGTVQGLSPELQNLPFGRIHEVGSALGDLSKFSEANTLKDYLTPDQAVAYGVDQPFIQSFGGNPIPRQVAQGYVSNKSRAGIQKALEGRTAIQGERLDFDQRNTISKQVNGMLASGSSNLGRLQQNNIRSFRALKILDKKGPLSRQEYDLVTSDLSGIIQGGAPLRETLGEQRFNTLMGDIANRIGYLKSQPASVDTPEVRAILKKNIQDIVQADNASIDQNFNSVAAAQAPFIQRNQAWFNNLKEQVKQGTKPDFIESFGQDQGGGNEDLASISSMSDDELRQVAAGGQ